METVKYGYFRVRTYWDDGGVIVIPKRYGYISGVMKRPEKGSGKDHEVGFSYCSPFDIFNKQMGRKIAEGRLEKKGIKVSGDGKEVMEIFEIGLEAAIGMEDAPSWVRRGVILEGLRESEEENDPYYNFCEEFAIENVG